MSDTRDRRRPTLPGVARLGALVAVGAAQGVAHAQTRTYRVDIDNTWSEASHPGAFPATAHFSWFGGASYSEQVSFWEVGEPASPGMVQMAEIGVTTTLLDEVDAAIADGTAYATYNQTHWFCPDGIDHPNCGDVHSFMIEVHEDFPLLTLVSMVGPSPDWFVGFDDLPLREDGDWIPKIVVDLHPYDAGTRSANAFALGGPETIPPDPITVITEETGQIITPASLGTITLTLCPADVNGDGILNILDFVAFQTAFQQQELIADCNLDGAYSILDFVCFQQLFVDACP